MFLSKHLKIYHHPNEFVEYLTTDKSSERIFLIVSGTYDELLISQVKDHPSIVFIYVFCLNSTYHKQWINSYPNIRNVFTDKSILFDKLATDIRLYTNYIPAFSIFNLNNKQKSMRDLSKDNATFMWYQLLIDLLLRMSKNDGTNATPLSLNALCRHWTNDYLIYACNKKK